MPSPRTFLQHAALVIAVLWGMEAVANSVGGVTAQVIRGDVDWRTRMLG